MENQQAVKAQPSNAPAANHDIASTYKRWPFILASYIAGALAISGGCFAYYNYYWGTYDNFNRSIEFCELTYCDFVLFYYEQAKVILQSHSPIHKYFYSATFALFLVPLGRLRLDQAVDIWTWVQAVSLLAFVASGVALLRSEAWWAHAVFLFVTLTSYPILHNWKWGQANTTFIALTMSSLALGERVPAGWRALPLAVATSARYYPALYLLSFVERQQWRVVAWFTLLCVLLLVALPALTMGGGAALDFYVASAEASAEATKTWVLGYSGSQYISSVLGRHGAALRLNTSGAQPWLMAAGYALAGVNVLAALRAPGPRETRSLWTFCFLGLCTPLLLPTSWVHYFVYLPLAHTFLLTQTVRVAWPVSARAALLLGLWAPSVVGTSIFFFNEQGTFSEYTAAGYPFWSNLLLMVLAHVVARQQRSAKRTTSGYLAAVTLENRG